MPDITYRFIGEDQLTAMINQLKAALGGLVSQSKVPVSAPSSGGGFKQIADEVKIYDFVASQATKSATEVAAATAKWRAEMGMAALGAQMAAKATMTWGEVQAQTASKMGSLTRAATEQAAAQRGAVLKYGVTQIPTPQASAFGQMGEGMERARAAGEGLSGTLGMLGGHLARMPLYILAFKALELAMESIRQTASVLIPNIQDVSHWMHMAGASGENWAASFGDLYQAAVLTNTALGETQKRAMAFVAAGSSMAEAAKQAGNVQLRIQQTGVDLTDVYTKAQVYGATIQDALKAGSAANPVIQERALQDELWQNTLKFRENDMQKRQHAAQHSYELEHRGIQRAREDREESDNYAMEDRHRAENYAMEDSHRNIRRQQEAKRTAIEDNLEDTQHAEDRAQELSHIGMERAMEDRHTLLEREMEDRDKAQSRAQQDLQREHQERLAIAQSVAGAEQAVAEGRGMVVGQIGKKRVRVPIPASIQATIKAEQEEGYAELEREGVSRSEAQYMIRAHVMSPGALTQAAERARERKAEEADRKRDDEAQKQERQFQDESRAQGRTIHDESIALSEVHYEQRKEASRGLRDEERAAGYKMEDEQTGQTRRQTQESQEQARTFRAWDKENTRVDQDYQSAVGEKNYQEQQGQKDEGLRQDKQRQDDLNDLQQNQLNDYNKRIQQVGGLGTAIPGALLGLPPIPAPYVHERSMFKGGQALKTKDDAVLRKVQELINIFLK